MMLRKICQAYLNTHLKLLYPSAHILARNPLCSAAGTYPQRSSSSSSSHSPAPEEPLTSPTVHFVDEMLGNLKKEPATEELFQGVINHDRASLAKAITLVESSNKTKQQQAQLLLTRVLHYMKVEDAKHSGGLQSFRIVQIMWRTVEMPKNVQWNNIRILDVVGSLYITWKAVKVCTIPDGFVGLSGPPGAGKSTFIEYFGKKLTSMGHRVAVLAVDPSSSTTGGSLLADKTRMQHLAVDPMAFIRPSPSCGTLGGVARNTSEAVVLCEGAGFDIVIIETMGVGQSEFAVADMVDLFCLLLTPAGGDELQGIKRGIVEVSDLVVVNKSDGDFEPAARRIQTEYISALKFMKKRSRVWRPQVLRVSSLTGMGMDQLWENICKYREVTTDAGELRKKRQHQLQVWMWNHIRDRILNDFQQQPGIAEKLPELEKMVRSGAVTPGLAADVLLDKFFGNSS